MEAAERANLIISQKYSKERKIGEGRQIATGRKIAIKKIKVGEFKEGLDMSAIREVKFLQELRHPNIIELLDVFSSKQNLNLVLEFLDTDLEAVIKDRDLIFQSADIKSWMAMCFKGLDYCHRCWVLHRDLKPNNLLIAPDGTPKIADFGLAREFADTGTRMSHQVVTRWYRSPELLMNTRAYDTAVDVWAAGCILAELMLRIPYLPGESDLDQLQKIFQALGTPQEGEWPGLEKLKGYVRFDKIPKTRLGDLFTAATPDCIDLLGKTLIFDPKKRISARQALEHPYFHTSPYPTPPSKLPKPTGQLQPRALPPSEVDNAGTAAAKKRKGGDEPMGSVANGEGRFNKVARKLEF